MYCLKCGRETAEDFSFCQECLTDMAKYPVQSGAPVVLPRRQDPPVVRKAPRKRPPTAEDQIRKLNRRIRFLIWLTAIATALALLFAIPAWRYVESRRPRPGQNYTVVTEDDDNPRRSAPEPED